MIDKIDIDLSDANRAGDPDKDGLPGITMYADKVKGKIKIEVQLLAETEPFTIPWFERLHAIMLLYYTNYKYIAPVVGKVPFLGWAVNIMILGIGIEAKLRGIKSIDLISDE